MIDAGIFVQRSVIHSYRLCCYFDKICDFGVDECMNKISYLQNKLYINGLIRRKDLTLDLDVYQGRGGCIVQLL